MSRQFDLPAIYPITDTALSGMSHPQQVERLIAGGARLIQLREKHAAPRDFYVAAKAALEVAREHEVPLIINDRVDIALALGADGVHVGQDDLPPEKVRMLLGDGAIIGFSTHSVEQAIRAVELPIDYLAFGPIFATQTKQNADPVVGIAGLREVRAATGTVPLVAIGGITRENIGSVFEAGADSAAIITALFADPAAVERNFRDLLSLVR